jgi:hypothetical protein
MFIGCSGPRLLIIVKGVASASQSRSSIERLVFCYRFRTPAILFNDVGPIARFRLVK